VTVHTPLGFLANGCGVGGVGGEEDVCQLPVTATVVAAGAVRVNVTHAVGRAWWIVTVGPRRSVLVT
jgi:hypothetical protein